KTGGRHVDEKPCHIPSPLLAELRPPLACERRAWFVLRLAGEFRSCRPLAANLTKQKRGPNSSLALASPATYRHGTTPYQKSPVRPYFCCKIQRWIAEPLRWRSGQRRDRF